MLNNYYYNAYEKYSGDHIKGLFSYVKWKILD